MGVVRSALYEHKTAVGLLMLCSTGAQAGLLSLLDVATLKESKLEMCPNISVEKMVNSFSKTPSGPAGKRRMVGNW